MNKQRVAEVAQWLFQEFGIRPDELQPIPDKDMQECREQEQVRKQLALLWAEAEAE